MPQAQRRRAQTEVCSSFEPLNMCLDRHSGRNCQWDAALVLRQVMSLLRCNWQDQVFRAIPLVIVPGKPELVLKESAQFGPGFIIVARIVERQSPRVNLIDRNVNMHVVGIVMNDAHSLMFSVAERVAKTFLDHP